MYSSEDKFTFDYFAKRTQLFNEMARPDKEMIRLGDIGSLYQSIFTQMGNIMKSGKFNNEPIQTSEGRVVPGFPSKDRQLKYAFITLLDAVDDQDSVDIDTNNEKEFNNMITGAASKYLLKRIGQSALQELKSTDAKMRAAIIKLIEDNPTYIKSDKFKQDFLNPTAIADFITMKKLGDTEYSWNRAKSISKKYNLNYDDVLHIKANAKDMVTRLNIIAKNKKRRKIQPNKPQKEDQNENFLENIEKILKKINDFRIISHYVSKIKDSFNKEMNDSPRQLINGVSSVLKTQYGINLPSTVLATMINIREDYLDEVYEHFEAFEEDGIPMYLFNEEIESLKEFMEELPDSENKETPILDAIQHEMITLTQKEDGEEFPGFDQDDVNQVVNTPEKKEAFDAWYWKIYRKDLEEQFFAVKEKLDALTNTTTVDGEDWSPMRPEELRAVRSWKSKNELELDRNRSTTSSKNKSALEIYDTEVDKDEDFMQPKIDKFKKAHSHLLNDDDDDSNEEDEETPSTMMYMANQLRKDQLNRPKGKFVDRGFKKVQNYNQWLINNR